MRLIGRSKYTSIMDAEKQQPSRGADDEKRGFVYAGKIPLPLRRRYVVSDVLKMVLCFAILAYVHCLSAAVLLRSVANLLSCRIIGQAYWISSLRAGNKRINNDDFDHLFSRRNLEGNHSIWDDSHQAFIRNATPVPVHSHNDYKRRIPLFEALASGCISIEADVHLVDGDLLVGHHSRGLKATHSLRKMYLEPLQRMLESRNPGPLNATDRESWRGIFGKDPKQTVVLLVDHKGDGEKVFAEVNKQLQPLRVMDYLTHWNGSDKVSRPLTIVATGKAPFGSIMGLSETHRDVFWDAPLAALPSASDDFTTDPPTFKYNQSNSHYASTQYRNRNAVGWRPEELGGSLLKAQNEDLAATQAEQAAARGLLSRYWETPKGPPNLRDSVWRWSINLKTGLTNVDDMGLVRDRSAGWGMIPELAA